MTAPRTDLRMSVPSGWLWAVLATWIAFTAFALFAAQGQMASAQPRGPDDLLRLVQVRDWLAGQALTDVSQYRLNTPHGAPMHWSRIVDAPIAAVVLLLTPLVGAAKAELAGMLVIPALTMLAIMVGGTLLVRRFVPDPKLAILVPLFVAATPLVAVQAWPFRIDHHGWQIALSVAAVAALFARDRTRGSALAGLLLAVNLAVSIEALPFAAMVGGVLAVRAVLSKAEARRLTAYVGALAAVSVLLFAALQPPSLWSAAWCDAMMPTYLGALCVAAVLLMGLHLTAVSTPLARGIVIAAAGAGAFAALSAVNPACAAGPFAALDPIVQGHWYGRIKEGLPLWHSEPVIIFSVMVPLALGAAGYALLLKGGARRADVLTMAALFVGSALLGVLVMRASALATVLALPGLAALLSAGLTRVSEKRGPARLVGAALVILLLFPATPLMAWTALPKGERGAQGDAGNEPLTPATTCRAAENYALLAAMPETRLLTPLDLAPAVFYASDHSVVASSHHRNNAGIAATLRAFLGDGEGEAARALMAGRGLTHLVFCERSLELRDYAERAPGSFAERLFTGEVPGWLVPVPGQDPENPVRIYAIGPTKPSS
jgi:hypothetical protein